PRMEPRRPEERRPSTDSASMDWPWAWAAPAAARVAAASVAVRKAVELLVLAELPLLARLETLPPLGTPFSTDSRDSRCSLGAGRGGGPRRVGESGVLLLLTAPAGLPAPSDDGLCSLGAGRLMAP